MKTWNLADFDKNEIKQIAEKNNISDFLSMLLYVKGIKDDFIIDYFLSDEVDLSDPYIFADMEKAVKRINEALNSKEKICVFGDYDTDGITSTYILYSYLKSRGLTNAIYYIPDRANEGYGMNIDAISKLIEKKVKLIITVDNGISSINEVNYANDNGIDVVITDHHQIRNNNLPNAVAVVNPHREDCLSEFKDYAGVGVTFELLCALEGESLDCIDMLQTYGNMVALGTIADIVPLKEENRSIVKYTLKNNIKNENNLGLQALLDETQLTDKEITSTDLALRLIPKLNVMGRLHHANEALALLFSRDENTAHKIAKKLVEKNSERQSIDKNIVATINEMISKDRNILKNRVIVVDNKNWNPGVIGIAASKISQEYGKPCIIISRGATQSVASGRSVEGFSLYDLLYSCKDILNKFGGHHMAAGFSINTDKISEFKAKIEENAVKMCKYMPYNSVNISCKFNPLALSLELVDEINKLQPFGMGNEIPILGLFNIKIVNVIPLAQGKHTKLIVEKKGYKFETLMFGTNIESLEFVKDDIVDLAVTIDKNVFNGNTNLSIIINDIKFSSLNHEQILKHIRIYENFIRNEELSLQEKEIIYPNRDECVIVYKYLRRVGYVCTSIYNLLYRINNDRINIAKLNIILDVFEELKLIDREILGKYNEIRLINVNNKVDLMSSLILNKLK